MVFLSEAAKLVSGAELVARGAGELDVKGRGGEVNLGVASEKQGDNRQVNGGCHPQGHTPASLPFSLPPPQPSL